MPTGDVVTFASEMPPLPRPPACASCGSEDVATTPAHGVESRCPWVEMCHHAFVVREVICGACGSTYTDATCACASCLRQDPDRCVRHALHRIAGRVP